MEQNEIKQAYCLTLDWDPASVDANTDLTTRSGWDSINQLRVLMGIEARLRVKLPLKGYLACRTIEEVAKLVAQAKH